MPKKKTVEDPAEQLADFKKLAERIGADTALGSTERVMKRLAKQKRRRTRASDKAKQA